MGAYRLSLEVGEKASGGLFGGRARDADDDGVSAAAAAAGEGDAGGVMMLEIVPEAGTISRRTQVQGRDGMLGRRLQGQTTHQGSVKG